MISIKKYNTLSKQAKASLWFLICGFLQKAVAALTTPIFTRIMTTDEYGQYNVYNSWFMILNIVFSLNICGGIFMQGYVKFNNDKKFTSSLLGLTTFLVVLWSLIYVISHEYINTILELNSIKMTILFLTIILHAAFNFWAVEQRVEFSYNKLVSITILVSILSPLVGIILMHYIKDKVLARLFGTLIAELVFYIPLYVSILINGKCIFDIRIWKYGFKLGLPLMPHYLSQIVLNNSDRIMIKKLVDDSSAGIYSLAYSLSLLMTLFSSSLLQTLEPWIYLKIKEDRKDEIGAVAYLSMIIVGILNIILILFAPEILLIFAPNSYSDAVWVIPPVSMSVFFMFIYSFFATFEFYYEKTNYIAIGTTIGAVLNIILNLIFINIFGYIAAAYTTLFCYIIYATMHYWIMKKLTYNVDKKRVYDGRIILLISIVFVIIGFIIELLYSTILLRIAFCILIFLFMFLMRNRIIITLETLFKKT